MNKIYKLLFGVFFVMFFAIFLRCSDYQIVSAQSFGYSSSGQTITNIYNSIYSSGDMIITELHPQNTTNCLDEYIIIQSNISYSGKIELPGLGSSNASVTIYTSLVTGQKLLITDNISKINSGTSNPNIYIVSSITLTDGGETLGIKLGSSGTLVDNIIYTSPATEKSKFFGSNSGSLRVFDINSDPTPDKSCSVVAQPTTAVENCEIYISDESDSAKVKFAIKGSYSNICSQGIWSGDGLVTNANCGLELSPKLGYNHLKYNLYSGGQIICQSNYTYYMSTNTVTNCQNGYTNSTCQTSSNTSSSNTSSSSSSSSPSNGTYLAACGVRLQSSLPIYSENYVNLAATRRDSIIYNSNTSYRCQRDFANGQKSTECNPPSFKYYLPGMYDVKLTMTDGSGSICESSYFLNLPSKYWMINWIDNSDYMSGRVYSSDNFIINYTGFIKTGDFVLCDKNYYKLLYDKTKDKYNYLLDLYHLDDKQIKYIEKGYSLTGDFSDLLGLITKNTKASKAENSSNIYKKYNLTLWSGEDLLQISKIIPNPVGTDSSGEYIQIMSFDGDISLEGKYIYYGSKKYSLHGYANESGLDLIDKFGFSNEASCVYIGDTQYIYDVICYDKAKSGYIYGSGFEDTGDIIDANLDLLKSTKDWKYILPLASSKYMSGVLVCGGSSDKYTRQIANLKKTNSNLRATNAKNRKSYSTRVAKLNAKFKSDKKYYMDKEKFARYDMYIYRNYAQILNSKLKKDYDIVRKDEEIQDYNHLLNIGLRNLASGYVDGYFEGKKIKSYDLKKIYKISSGQDIYISDIFGLIDPETNNRNIDLIQYERNAKYILSNKSIKNDFVGKVKAAEKAEAAKDAKKIENINITTKSKYIPKVSNKISNKYIYSKVIPKLSSKSKDIILPKDIDRIGGINDLIWISKK